MTPSGPPPPHPALSASLAVDHQPIEGLPVTYLRNGTPGRTFSHPRLSDLGHHTLFMGTTGSGKTTALKLHLKSVLCPVRATLPSGESYGSPPWAMNFRALLYDPKRDLLPFLGSLGFSLDEHVIITNPFDARASAWDVAADADTFTAADTFAEILVPPSEGGESPFWHDASRSLVANAIHGLNEWCDSRADRWTFRHLTEVLSSPEHLRTVLHRTSSGRGSYDEYIDAAGDGMTSSVVATLRTIVAPHRFAAAGWDNAEHSFSFRKWARGGGVLVLGDDYLNEEKAQHINNLLVRYAFRSALAVPGEILHTTTWFYLDEMRRAGRFPGFGNMLTQSRSKGVRAVLAAQGLSTLQAALPEHEVAEVINNCAEKCVMQLGSPEDAEWAERLFATAERVRTSRTESGREPGLPSYTYSTEEQPRIRARDFYALAAAHQTERGLDCYCHRPGGDYDRTTRPGSWVAKMLEPVVRGPLPPAFVERPPSEFAPRELSESEVSLLGLSSYAPAAEPVSEAPTTTSLGARAFRLPPPPTPL